MTPPILLFGYHSSAFTLKARLALRLKSLPYTHLTVPSMPPRPLLLRCLALPYRKIPVLCIGRDVYVDTSLITSALESRFPPTTEGGGGGGGVGTLFPGNTNPGVQRLWVRAFVDAALFRTTTGLIPARVWRSRFGADRGRLIGHALDADKLEAKVPWNVAALDSWLSVLETQFGGGGGGGEKWVCGTSAPGLADVALWAQVAWGVGIAVGRGVGDLTGYGAVDGGNDGVAERENARAGEWVGRVWCEERYPGLWRWFQEFEAFVEGSPVVEEVVDGVSDEEKERVVVERLAGLEEVGLRESMIGMPAGGEGALDDVVGLTKGTEVVITPDDTGRGE